MIILACLVFAALLTGAVVHLAACVTSWDGDTLAKSKDAKKGDQP